MDTLKNILKPGGKKDDELLYGSTETDPNRGKIAGEGSHFPSRHAHTDSGIDVGSPTSPTAGKSAVATYPPVAETAEPTTSTAQSSQPVEHIHPTSGATGASATKTAEPGASEPREFPLTDDTTGKTETTTAAAPVHQSTTVAPVAESTEWPLKDTSNKESNILGQRQDVVDTKADGSEPKKAADIPGDLEGPVHKSKILNDLDPRVKAHPGSATTGGHHSVPKVGETHHDNTARNVALGAGAGAAGGAAAHEGEKYYDAPSGATPSEPAAVHTSAHQPMTSQPTTTSGPGVEYRTLDPKADPDFANKTMITEPPNTTSGAPYFAGQEASTSSSHPGAAAAGTAAAVGGTTVLASHHRSHPPTEQTPADVPSTAHQKSTETQLPPTTTTTSTHQKSTATELPPSTTTHQKSTTSELPPSQAATTEPKSDEHHYGRDAAIVGGAAGAGALAGHELSKKEAEERAKEQAEHQKEVEKIEKQEQKEAEKAQKEAEKEQKQHEKEVEKEQKQHQKEVEKAEKKEQKEIEKQQKEQDKAIYAEAKKQEKEEEKAKKEAEKEQKKAEKQAEKEHAAAIKEEEKKQKEAEKEAEKARKEEEKHHAALVKEQEKEQKKAEKEAEKQHAAHVKAEEKERKEAEKQAEKEQKEAEKEAKKAEKEEKPGLISRLLHRNKDDEENDAEHEKHKHEAEGAAAGVVAGAGGAAALEHARGDTTGTDSLPTTATEAPATSQDPAAASPTIPERKSSVRNRLHKDPPADHPAAQAIPESKAVAPTPAATAAPAETATAPAETTSEPATTSGTEKAAAAGAAGTAGAAAASSSHHPVTAPTRGSTEGTPPIATKGQTTGTDGLPIVPGTRYGSGHDEHVHSTAATSSAGPTSGYASQVTGGTGTTALAQGETLDPAAVPQQTAGELPGVQSETPYEPAPTKGYATQVTGGTGTTQLARGDEDPATTTHKESLVEKIKGALVMK